MKNFNFSYIGSVNQSAKLNHDETVNTYCIYLAPFDLSGYQVCAKASKECVIGCLNTSGRVKIDKSNSIIKARIERTKAFYEFRNDYMKQVFNEITKAQKKAKKDGQKFAIRLNGTSDLNPILYTIENKKMLDIFNDVQFYDYTKILNRFKLLDKYKNYHLTFSYTGYNWNECLTVLNEYKGNVAVIFNVKKGKALPETFNGFKVIDGDKSDYRPQDEKQVIVGLRWKNIKDKTNNELIKNSPFVVNL